MDSNLIYVSSKGSFTFKPSNIRNFSAKLEKVGEISSDEVDQFLALYRMQGFNASGSNLCDYDAFEKLSTLTQDFVFYQSKIVNYDWGLIYRYNHSNWNTYRFWHFKVVKRNFLNPDLLTIAEKTKATKALNKNIVENVDLITNLTSKCVSLDRDLILEYINAELIKKGYAPLKKYIDICI